MPPAPPPDMLSGGGRQVLASYTAFSYQGNFSDVACRLMDILPHQSPAVGVSKRLRDPPLSPKFVSSSSRPATAAVYVRLNTLVSVSVRMRWQSQAVGFATQEAASRHLVCLFQRKAAQGPVIADQLSPCAERVQ